MMPHSTENTESHPVTRKSCALRRSDGQSLVLMSQPEGSHLCWLQCIAAVRACMAPSLHGFVCSEAVGWTTCLAAVRACAGSHALQLCAGSDALQPC